jgi:type III secretion system FlhB-like substrate exporter
MDEIEARASRAADGLNEAAIQADNGGSSSPRVSTLDDGAVDEELIQQLVSRVSITPNMPEDLYATVL